MSAVAVCPPNISAPSAAAVSPVPPPSTFKVPETVGENVNVPAALVIVRRWVCPLTVALEVASVIAPVCAEPNVCWSERRPVFVTLPPEYARPDEKVVVAVPNQPVTPFCVP